MTDLLEIADRLYALAPSEFTAARDTIAKQRKADGEPELAVAVKKLKRPSLAAWVVNLLVRREADQVAQVLQVGAALREASAAMDGAELRELTRQRRQLTSAVTGQARSLAAEEGMRLTDSVADQVEGTLTAAMIDERCAAAVRTGLLIAALASTGVDDQDPGAALAVPEAAGFEPTPTQAAPTPGSTPRLQVVPDPEPDETARREAAEALAEAEAAVARAQQEVAEIRSSVDRLEAHGLELQARADELRRELAEVTEELDGNDDELSDAEDSLAEAQQALREAEQEQAQAAERVASLE